MVKRYSIEHEKIKKIIEDKTQRWRYVRVGNEVYFPSKKEGAKEIFKLLKKLEGKVLASEIERKSRQKELEKEATILPQELLERISQKKVKVGDKVFIPFNSPITQKTKFGEKRIFVRGGILLEVQDGEKGNLFWKVKEVVGNLEKVGLLKERSFLFDLKNAPFALKQVLEKLESEKEKAP